MIALMDRWSLDGRDPNSYAGYMWTLGRYDRPWPERPIYGTVRSMSSQNSAKRSRSKYLWRRIGFRIRRGSDRIRDRRDHRDRDQGSGIRVGVSGGKRIGVCHADGGHTSSRVTIARGERKE